MNLADARIAVAGLVASAGAQVVPITEEIGRVAVEAFARFGRGNHPARLNMGDCVAYACARDLDVPLLCKGDDFAQTDIGLA
jgi:ribonuclease VapC